MQYDLTDFIGADAYFAGPGAPEWVDLHAVLSALQPQLQPSDQSGKRGNPIFDPKAMNARLTATAFSAGWKTIPVPPALQEFGKSWDCGKNETLVEWQFSNYPFLWNNIIRTQGVYATQTVLPGLKPIKALVIVTKSGSFPASNSTLYYEQARAQISAAMSFNAFTVPIRLVGLLVPSNAQKLTADWNTYSGRYSRDPEQTQHNRVFRVVWGAKGQYGNRSAQLIP